MTEEPDFFLVFFQKTGIFPDFAERLDILMSKLEICNNRINTMQDFRITKSYTNRSQDSLHRYLSEIASIPLLSKEEEVLLSAEIKKGNRAAEERLIEANLRFVVSCAKRYQSLGVPLSDLICEGNLGLIKAAKLFDPSRGFKFISYAVWWIRQAMLAAIQDYGRLIRVPMNQQITLNQISKSSEILSHNLQREPTLAELSKMIDKTESQLADCIRINERISYLEDNVPSSQSEQFTLLSVVCSDDLEHRFNQMDIDALNFGITNLLATLSQRDRKIIILAFGLFGFEPLDNKQISHQMGLSAERISQLRSIAISKLRKLEGTQSLKEYA